MKVRALDFNNDWTFGKGRNNYIVDNQALRQNIQTRLSSFLADCFFALDEGIDWFGLNGSKREQELRLQISATILNTEGVISLKELRFTRGAQRVATFNYSVETIYGPITDTSRTQVGPVPDPGGGGSMGNFKYGNQGIINNSSDVAITDFEFVFSEIVSARIYATAYRKDDIEGELTQTIILNLMKKPDSQDWLLSQDFNGDSVGLIFKKSVSGNGDVSILYDSTEFTGAGYEGTIYYEIRTLSEDN